MEGHGGAQEGISYLLRELGERNRRIQQLEKDLHQTRARLELIQRRLVRLRAKR